jgi:hypothetical protein
MSPHWARRLLKSRRYTYVFGALTRGAPCWWSMCLCHSGATSSKVDSQAAGNHYAAGQPCSSHRTVMRQPLLRFAHVTEPTAQEDLGRRGLPGPRLGQLVQDGGRLGARSGPASPWRAWIRSATQTMGRGTDLLLALAESAHEQRLRAEGSDKRHLYRGSDDSTVVGSSGTPALTIGQAPRGVSSREP